MIIAPLDRVGSLTAPDVQGAAPLTALARAVGLRRRMPPGAQVVEEHAVREGDQLVLVADGALDVRVAARLAGTAA